MKAFSFNPDAKYKPGLQDLQDNTLTAPQLDKINIQVQAGRFFEAHFSDVFENYILPKIKSDQINTTWNTHPMQFWQNQLNWAVWCATTGCGVSIKDHLDAEEPGIRSLYRFHAYYQIRRILDEIQAPLPQDQAWSPISNPYDRRAYERICADYGLSPHNDWTITAGLGTLYNYATFQGYMPLRGKPHYNPYTMSFTKKTTNKVLHIDYIKQDSKYNTAWKNFIMDNSDGFTHSGLTRLNDSIRTYVWAILGAQAQTRTSILGTGTAFDAQKQFMMNVEDAINSPVDLPSAISRYQDVLRYAGSEVNYVYGIGLYMAPGDMLLQIGRVVGYNNKIIIATNAQTLGLNKDANLTSNNKILDLTNENNWDENNWDLANETINKVWTDTHEDNKTAIIISGISVGILTIWFLSLRSR